MFIAVLLLAACTVYSPWLASGDGQSSAARTAAPGQGSPGEALPEVGLLSNLPTEVLGQVGGQSLALAVAGEIVYLGVGPRLAVVDVTNPSQPHLLSQSDLLSGVVHAVALEGRRVYVGAGEAVHVLEIREGSHPREIGTIPLGQKVQDVTVANGILYAAAGRCAADNCQGSLHVVNAVDASAPLELGVLGLPDLPYRMAAGNGAVYVAHGQGITAVDVGDPTELAVANLEGIRQDARDIVVEAGNAFVAADGLWTFDIGVPTSPTLLNRYEPVQLASTLVVSREIAYVGETFCQFGQCELGLLALDVRAPREPKVAGIFRMPGAVADAALSGDHLYLAMLEDGLAVVDAVTASEMQLVGTLGTQGSVIDVAAGSSMLVTANGSDSGLVSWNLANPGLSGPAGDLPGLRWADGLQLLQGLAYVPAWTDGVWIADVSDPDNLQPMGAISGTDLGGPAHGLAAFSQADGTVYVYVATGGGIRLLDATDPAAPRLVGVLAGMGEVVEVALAYGVLGDSRPALLLLAAGSTGTAGQPTGFLRVIDVSDPLRPDPMGQVPLTGGVWDIEAVGTIAFLLEGSCIEGACASGLSVVDLGEPSRPQVVAGLEFGATGQSLRVLGDLAYVAAGETGVVIVDVAEPGQPRVLGVWDTPGSARRVEVHPEDSDILFVADGGAGLIELQGREQR